MKNPNPELIKMLDDACSKAGELGGEEYWYIREGCALLSHLVRHRQVDPAYTWEKLMKLQKYINSLDLGFKADLVQHKK